MNRATRIIVSVIGAVLGLSGINHGFFETLQGNTPTPGLIIQAIGDAQQMWKGGTEEAFSLVPNFLFTGLLAILAGLAIIVWSLGFMHTRHAAAVFILLFVVLFLVGGGIGQIAFFVPAWLVATRIDKPLTWWRKVLPEKIRPGLARLWPWTLAAACVSFLIALEIAIFGFVPGVSDPDRLLAICWTLLLAGLLLFFFTCAAGFAHDIQARKV